VYFSGQERLGSSGPEVLGDSSAIGVVATDSLRTLLTILLVGLSFLSLGVVGVAAEAVVVFKSKAPPGVFGVLAADPNEANAPEPRPKAEEPDVVGEASPLFVNGDMALKGFLPPCDELSPPRRFEAGNVRGGGSDLSLWDMDNESLLVLRELLVIKHKMAGFWGLQTWSAESIGCRGYPWVAGSVT
jgi:hypothetical protein